MDVGGFAEPRKILSVCLPSYEQLSVHHRSDFLTISIRADGLSGV